MTELDKQYKPLKTADIFAYLEMFGRSTYSICYQVVSGFPPNYWTYKFVLNVEPNRRELGDDFKI